MNIEFVSPKELKPNPKNRNKHPKEQIERLAKIISEQGFRRPIVVSNQSGMVVVGHGRLMAAKKLGLEKVPVIYQDYATPELEYADQVADNAVALWAELDIIGINSDLPELGPDFDIDLLGIKNFTLDVSEKEYGCDEDEVPEHVEPKTKLGDIYQLGNHRLMCGDSTSITDVERLMNGEKADMVFTDPPYGYEYQSNHQNKHNVLKNDDKILDFLPCVYASTKENAAIFICGSHQTFYEWKKLLNEYSQYTYKNLIVWKKNNWSMGDLKGAFAGQHELIFFYHKGKIELIGERSRDVWEFDRDPPKEHPTQKPIALIEFAISKVPSTNTLDLFGGSGSTIIACEKTNRKCFMMELDPHYCDVIVARWEKFTGKKAELLNG